MVTGTRRGPSRRHLLTREAIRILGREHRGGACHKSVRAEVSSCSAKILGNNPLDMNRPRKTRPHTAIPTMPVPDPTQPDSPPAAPPVLSATFAVVSDLHCRLATDAKDSFLTVGALRSPSSRHPVQALLDLIDTEKLRADALLVPGDLTNRARIEGLQEGWGFALEIGRSLKASDVIPVIGNHDVDSFRADPEHPPTHAVRNLRPEFPFREHTNVQSFFSDGYCLLRAGAAQIVAVNTVIDHNDPIIAKRGSFGSDRIERMERALEGKFSSPLRGALMHHHPFLHSSAFMNDTDVIPTGDELIAALRRLGCRFVVHGHKHFTRLSNVDGVAILASGSFSAMLNEFSSAVGNTFHMIRVQGSTPDDLRGVINTWAFRYNQGWRRSDTEHGFPYTTGFGRTTPLQEIISRLRTLGTQNAGGTRYPESEVLATAPQVEYLTPGEREQVNQALKAYDLKLSDVDDGQLELWRAFRP
jgi:predicted phosphodiesterase